MKQANHLFMAFLLIAALGLASCSGEFDEHPVDRIHTRNDVTHPNLGQHQQQS